MTRNDLLEDSVYIERVMPPALPRLPAGTTILTGPRWRDSRDKGMLLSGAASEGWRIVVLQARDSEGTPWLASIDADGRQIDLRNTDEFYGAIGSPNRISIDINALGLSVWAPALRMFRARVLDSVTALYVRPRSYRLRMSSVGPVYSPEYDFNAQALGVRPVAGFGRLPAMASQDGALLIALLGLEGKRAQVALRELGDPTPTTSPVFALPGYSRRLAQRAIWAHRDFLEATESRRAVSYVPPINPFYVQRFIQERIDYYPGRHVYVMPLATKPMNLGAVLACLRNPLRTELVFDHPVQGSGASEAMDAYYIFELTDALKAGEAQ